MKSRPAQPFGKILRILPAAAIAIASLGCGGAGPAPAPPVPPGPPIRPMQFGGVLPYVWMTPGVNEPTTEPAASAEIDEDAEVIGVSMDGVTRAYDVEAMSQPETHVINDRLNGVPVTITFCDRSSCARVFTKAGRKEILDFGVMGWLQDKLLLNVDGSGLVQDSDEIPYDDLTFERTTWKQWKDAHPETDVFTRKGPGAAPQDQAGAADQGTTAKADAANQLGPAADVSPRDH